MKERARDEKAYAKLGCRSSDLPPTRPLSLDPSSSTFFFFNGVFRVWERACYVLYPQIGQVHAYFKVKKLVQTEKPYGKTNSCAENKRTRKCRGRTAVCPNSAVVRPTPWSVVNTTGRPWWPLDVVVSSLLEHCVFSFVWVTHLRSPVLGLLGLSCYFLDLVDLNFLLFS